MNDLRAFQPSDEVAAARRKRRNILIAVVAIIAVLLIAAFAFGRGSDEEATAGAEAGAIPTVSVVVPGKGQVERTIAASGPLAARREQPVGISGAGGKVTAVYVDAGQWVKQGQVLARVERSVQSQIAAQQQAQISSARAQAALAQNNYDRAAALVDNGFISKAELEAKRASRDQALAQVRVAEAALGQTRAQIAQLDVRAPTAGLVLSRNVEVGQIVSAGAGGLFRIAAGGEMEMQAALAQADLALVSTGMGARVTPVGSTASYQGNVWQVSPTIDPQSRQGYARISVPYDKAIRPGGFAEAQISVGAQTNPILPQSAVLADGKGNYVYLINEKNKVVRRDISIGEVSDTGVAVSEGLRGNEKVVLSAGPFLNPGQEVKPRNVAIATALSDR